MFFFLKMLKNLSVNPSELSPETEQRVHTPITHCILGPHQKCIRIRADLIWLGSSVLPWTDQEPGCEVGYGGTLAGSFPASSVFECGVGPALFLAWSDHEILTFCLQPWKRQVISRSFIVLDFKLLPLPSMMAIESWIRRLGIPWPCWAKPFFKRRALNRSILDSWTWARSTHWKRIWSKKGWTILKRDFTKSSVLIWGVIFEKNDTIELSKFPWTLNIYPLLCQSLRISVVWI